MSEKRGKKRPGKKCHRGEAWKTPMNASFACQVSRHREILQVRVRTYQMGRLWRTFCLLRTVDVLSDLTLNRKKKRKRQRWLDPDAKAFFSLVALISLLSLRRRVRNTHPLSPDSEIPIETRCLFRSLSMTLRHPNHLFLLFETENTSETIASR